MNNNENEVIEKLHKILVMTSHQRHHGGNSALRGQGRVLALLNMKPNISQRELTFLLDMSKQALAELLSKMEKKGYISRTPSSEDKRVMLIELTDEGRKIASEMDHHSNQFDYLFEDFDTAEIEQLNIYLDKLVANLEKGFPDSQFKEKMLAREQFMKEYGYGKDGRRHGRGPHRRGGRGHECERHHGEKEHCTHHE